MWLYQTPTLTSLKKKKKTPKIQSPTIPRASFIISKLQALLESLEQMTISFLSGLVILCIDVAPFKPNLKVLYKTLINDSS